MIELIKQIWEEKKEIDNHLQELLNEWAEENCPFKKDDEVKTEEHPGKWKVEGVLGKISDKGEPYWELDVTQPEPVYWVNSFTVREGVSYADSEDTRQ